MRSPSVERGGHDQDLFASAQANFALMTDRKSPSHLVSPAAPGHDVWTQRTNQTPLENRRREKINRVSDRVHLHFGKSSRRWC